jgi:hypothetical protein
MHRKRAIQYKEGIITSIFHNCLLSGLNEYKHVHNVSYDLKTF